MSKRFTETTIWLDPWFMGLPVELKCLWKMLCDQCDAVGVWKVNMPLLKLMVGKSIKEAEALEAFEGRVQKIAKDKWLIVKFCDFQYSNLSETCPAHKPVFRLLREHQAKTPNRVFDTLLNRDLNREQYKETEKETDKDKDRERDARERELKSPPDSDQPELFKAKRKASTVEEVIEFCRGAGLPQGDAEYFWHKCNGNGWLNGGKPIKDWQSVIRAWKHAGYMPSQKNGSGKLASPL